MNILKNVFFGGFICSKKNVIYLVDMYNIITRVVLYNSQTREQKL